ncbi:MAG: chorismate mutase, partial [Candidatus Omnitrophica bacterium]|nr:chorismate mutase [Candidatus Omnitrophota bacterium]
DIVSLLNKRAQIAIDVGATKKSLGKSVYCPDREREILKMIESLNSGPLKPAALEAIYREIMSSSLSLEKKLKIAFLGPVATFTHQAALKRFGSQVNYLSCGSIAEVFIEVEKGNADYGVVPIENSIEGAVNFTLDMFMDSDLKICSQVILNISHNLLSTGPLAKVKKVYSNPMVFGQCRIWLQKNLANAQLIEVPSTTRASQIAAKEKNSAAIASALAAKIYGLNIVARGIEDSPHNVTRFFVIGKDEVPHTGNAQTSVLVSILDRVGALHALLASFRAGRAGK